MTNNIDHDRLFKELISTFFIETLLFKNLDTLSAFDLTRKYKTSHYPPHLLSSFCSWFGVRIILFLVFGNTDLCAGCFQINDALF